MNLKRLLRKLLFPGMNLHARERYRVLSGFFGHAAKGEIRRFVDAGCGNGMLTYQAALRGNHVLGISIKDSEVKKAVAFFNEYIGVPADRLKFVVGNLYRLEEVVGEWVRAEEGAGAQGAEGMAQSGREGMAGGKERCSILSEPRTRNQERGTRDNPATQQPSNSTTGLLDEIVCSEVIEHLKRDREVVGAFARLLKPGGVLHLCCPNAEHPDNASKELDPDETGGHVRSGYTMAAYREMLEPLGFEIVASKGLGGPVRQWFNRRIIAWEEAAGFAPAFGLFVLSFGFVWMDPAEPKVPYSIYVKAVKRK